MSAGTRLWAVNSILARCGRGEVSSLHTGTTSDAANAERELDRASLSVQKTGWHFNTLRDVTLTVDSSDELTVPDGTIWIDSDGVHAHRNVTQVGNKLYDLDENRSTFPDDDTLQVRYCVLRTLECVPLPVREYIVRVATFNFVTQYGSRMFAPSELAVLRGQTFAEMGQARVDARRFNADTGNTNILDTQHVREVKGQRRTGVFGRGGIRFG